MKSHPQKNLNRKRQEIRGYKSFLNAGMSLSSSLHGAAYPSMQKRLLILDTNYKGEDIWKDSWELRLLVAFFLHPCAPQITPMRVKNALHKGIENSSLQ